PATPAAPAGPALRFVSCAGACTCQPGEMVVSASCPTGFPILSGETEARCATPSGDGTSMPTALVCARR
ncbi:hypothetical protein, partial [Rhodoplanes sp. SY1]|uniref:hypothetical protein n=1 Tax=Rhodoplanes sp. SY1 TaxID=3166646 RepID=UPI0038B4F20A